MREPFNPQEWLDKAKANPSAPSANADKQSFNPSIPQSIPSSDFTSEVDQVVTRVEADFADITTSYADWVNVGFAFAHEFGESGRVFYHRVSRFYSGYSKTETDQQYDRCLKAQGHGITIRTFFHLAKQANIDISTNEARKEVGSGRSQWSANQGDSPSVHQSISPSDDDSPTEEVQPNLPDFIFEQLPDFFKRVVARADSKEERDMLVLGAMVTLGSCLSTFSGIYDGNNVFPSLFLYVAAKASSGKGRLIMCRNLVNLVHWEKRKQSAQEDQQYEIDLKEYNLMKGKDLALEKPRKPPVRLHFIPANNTTAGFLQLVSDNDGQGLIIETEGDTIVQAFKNDISNFSDAIRKDFHHEIISGYRKTDHEYHSIDQPRFSIILSSTLGQLKGLIPSTENGLASRFLFYYMNLKPVWKNVFAHSDDRSLNQHFNELGQDFYNLYCTLRSKDPIEFRLSDEQQDEFNAFFTRMQDKYLVLNGLDYMAIIRRLGLIAFRMMMILTAMRIPETGDFSTRQQCSDEDFQTALAIVKVQVRHASYIISQLPEEVNTVKRGNKKEMFFEGLGERFGRKEFISLAKSLGITDRTADNYIAAFCVKGLISREKPNSYLKIMKT